MAGIGRYERRWGVRLLPTLVALSLTACDSTGPVVERILDVAPHQVVCSGVGFQFCLLVRDEGVTDWTQLYETPRGFEFEWGVRKRIVVEERERGGTPSADGSSIERRLVRVEAEEVDPADSLFVLVVPGGSTTATLPGLHRFDFSDGEAIRCDEAEDCPGLATALAGTDAVEVTLVLGVLTTAPFRVVEWRACGAPWPECGETP